ncbi:L,D-transpeptidase [Silicimonas algicola]|uniref:Lipoprotein-anchoring transpeptidase ErfK/SrfK n=1 Tax=Silicimonas algicola TaxID=1826607 RepID=A0A316G804_9RHOB|nr:L,D-transpeptidase [Silicimonas algicola]PWK56783.1 lipoprotein-anchoring transpeptidase ErfK/SrfK [Silicimonas algicola]
MSKLTAIRFVVAMAAGLALAACSGTMPSEDVGNFQDLEDVGDYGEVQEGHIVIPRVDPQYLQEPNRRTSVAYNGYETPGTIVVDPYAKFLYYVEAPGAAIRYPIAAGREGRGFQGEATVGRMAEWPGWTPTANMIRSEPDVYGPFSKGIPGGRANPLGARAIYLYRGNRDTYYRIHGTNDPATIGNSGSAGCIRLFNQDAIDLYNRVSVGSTVVVRTYEESVAIEGYDMANRGQEMAPRHVDPAEVYAAVAEDQRRKAEYEAGF